MRNKSANDKDGYVELQADDNRLTFIALIDGDYIQSGSGSLSGVRETFAQNRLTAVAVERAIIQVEDLIMPIIRTLPDCTELKVSGSEMENIFHLLPATNKSGVPIEAVEGLYRQLADYASGSPIAWRHNMPPEQAAVGLVTLREVMHHTGFRSVSLLPVRK